VTFENKGLLHINGILFHPNVEIRQAVHDTLLQVLLSSDLFTLWPQEALIWMEQLDGVAHIFKFLQKSVHHATTHILRLTGLMYTHHRNHAQSMNALIHTYLSPRFCNRSFDECMSYFDANVCAFCSTEQTKEICMSPLLLAACELAPHEDSSSVRFIQHYLNRVVVSFVHVARMDLEWIQSLVKIHLGESMSNWFDLSALHFPHGEKHEKGLKKKTIEGIRQKMGTDRSGTDLDDIKVADVLFKLSTYANHLLH
jgi:hypothetical protein